MYNNLQEAVSRNIALDEVTLADESRYPVSNYKLAIVLSEISLEANCRVFPVSATSLMKLHQLLFAYDDVLTPKPICRRLHSQPS